MSTYRFSRSLAILTVSLLFCLVMPAQGRYNNYDLNKPSAFRDYRQVMIPSPAADSDGSGCFIRTLYEN